MISLSEVWSEVQTLLGTTEAGATLDVVTAALVELAVNASVTALDNDGIERLTRHALAAGATAEQVHDTLVLVSGLGVHSLMEGSRRVAHILREQGNQTIDSPLDARRQALWDRFVSDDPYWDRMEQEAPGFLDALIRLSPGAFEAFFVYCAVPWRSKALSPTAMELISMAVDASPTHRYMPGVRLHLSNAMERGAGHAAIMQTLAIAARAPLHGGVR